MTKLKTCEICFDQDGYVYIELWQDTSGEWDGLLIRCPNCGKRGRPLQKFEYGYYIHGKREVLGEVNKNEYAAKKREIDYANKIDPVSNWFLEVKKSSQT